MLVIPQHFLTNSNISRTFADILLSFLVDRMGEMYVIANVLELAVLVGGLRILFLGL